MELHYSAIEAIHPRAFQEEAFKRGLRCDGRKLFECRRVGVAVLPRADHGNSVLASIGSTQVICGLRISRVDCGPVAAPSPAIPEDVAEPMEPDSSTRAAPSSEAAAHEAHFEVQYSALCGQHSARAGSSGVGASSVGARQPREAMRVSRLLQRVFQTSKCLDLAKLPSVPSDNEASGAAKRQAWKLEVTCIVVVDDGATDAACVTAAAACLSAVTFPTGNDSIGSSCNLLGRVPVALSLAVVATKATVDGTQLLPDAEAREEALAETAGSVVVEINKGSQLQIIAIDFAAGSGSFARSTEAASVAKKAIAFFGSEAEGLAYASQVISAIRSVRECASARSLS